LQVEDLASLRDELNEALPTLIAACEFGPNPITQVQAAIAPKKAKGKKDVKTSNTTATDEDDNNNK
jgi:hypothetical protein